ncbi:MAG: hypothetical protein FJ272_05600 [Planctomycetes bacterium]|nr:hypothetical protein [Planctomycetota bacterium]
MRPKLLLAALLASAVAWAEGPPVVKGHAQCLMIGAIGLKWEGVEGATGFVVYRSRDGQAWTKLAEVARSEYVDRHDLQPGATHFYAVASRKEGKESEKALIGMAANSANLVAGGDFEMDEPGATKPRCFATMSNEDGRLRIVAGARPGGAGQRMLQVTGDASAPIIRLHTRRYWIVPGATCRVLAWCKADEKGSAGLGGDILTADGAKSKHMAVTYFQSKVIEEGPDGWVLRLGWHSAVPDDAATLQLWALGWKTRGQGWFDDLQVIDERIAELARYDLPAALADVRYALSAARGAEKLRERAQHALAETEALARKVAEPGLGVDELLQASWRLLQAQRRLEDARWDLKIMGLKSASGGQGK